LDAGVLQLLILADILNTVNGHTIAITIVHNAMQENNYHLERIISIRMWLTE